MDMDALTLKEAAEVCKVSPATIRRRKEALREVGAICEPSGWRVSLQQLIAVGLTTRVRSGEAEQLPVEVTATGSSDTLVQALQAYIATLESDLARERIRADQAEARYDRLIEAPPVDVPLETMSPVVVTPDVEPASQPKQGFFRRLFG